MGIDAWGEGAFSPSRLTFPESSDNGLCWGLLEQECKERGDFKSLHPLSSQGRRGAISLAHTYLWKICPPQPSKRETKHKNRRIGFKHSILDNVCTITQREGSRATVTQWFSCFSTNLPSKDRRLSSLHSEISNLHRR